MTSTQTPLTLVRSSFFEPHVTRTKGECLIAALQSSGEFSLWVKDKHGTVATVHVDAEELLAFIQQVTS